MIEKIGAWFSNDCNLLLFFAFISFCVFLFGLITFIRRKDADFSHGWGLIIIFAMMMTCLWFGLNPEMREFEREELARKELQQKHREFQQEENFRAIGCWLIFHYNEIVKNPLPEPYPLVLPSSLKKREAEVEKAYNYIQQDYLILWIYPEYRNPASLPPDMHYWVAIKKEEVRIYPDGHILDKEWLRN